jgi:DAACS family dicarboxylate/amino acid:cation (Na+ or H+) symporter
MSAAVFAGLAAGVVARLLTARWPPLEWAMRAADTVGTLYVRALLMAALPLVVASLMLGVVALTRARTAGSTVTRTLTAFVLLAFVGAAVGSILGTMWIPHRPSTEIASAVQRGGVATAVVDRTVLLDLVPTNPIAAAATGNLAGLMVCALLFGVALARLAADTASPLLRVVQAINDAASIAVGLVMRLAPIGVAALMFAAGGRFGPELLGMLGTYLFALAAGVCLLHFVVFPAAASLVGGVPAAKFLRGSWVPLSTAFATASSTATLPTNVEVARDIFQVPDDRARFVLPLGATMSRAGTALFQALSIVFLARAFAIPLGLVDVFAACLICAVTSLAVAGIPGGAMPMLSVILPMVHIPAAAAALVLTVDPLTSMLRTIPNVTGSLLVSTLVAPARVSSEESLEKMAS